MFWSCNIAVRFNNLGCCFHRFGARFDVLDLQHCSLPLLRCFGVATLLLVSIIWDAASIALVLASMFWDFAMLLASIASTFWSCNIAAPFNDLGCCFHRFGARFVARFDVLDLQRYLLPSLQCD
jgi:hypothetical protein